MLIENEIKLDYKDVLIKPKRSTLKSRKDVNLFRSIEFRNAGGIEGKRFYGVPIIASNMDGVGTFTMANALRTEGIMTCLRKAYSVEELSEYFTSAKDNSQSEEALKNYTMMSIGATTDDLAKFNEIQNLTRNAIKYLCVDVANGYTEMFSEFITQLRCHNPFLVIIAGNVVTADQTQELLLSGADIIKVGIGPGSVCTTRTQTGVGYPQLSAIIECADAAHGLGGHIIADGGCTTPGCIAKAFGAGADFVMLGGMLAGHDEGGGEIVDGKIQFYGMSSEAANNKHFGGLKDYRSSEGREVTIPHKGLVQHTIQDILGSLRSSCTYIGAKNIKAFPKCTTFIRCNDTHNRIYEI